MKKTKKPFKKILIITGILGALSVLGITALFAWLILFTDNDKPTIVHIGGDYLFQEINKHRRDKGLTELELSDVICADIARRALYAKDNQDNPHGGLDEWVNEKPGWKVGEIMYISQGSVHPEVALYVWESSPSHKMILESTKATHMCTYVLDAEADSSGNLTRPQIMVAAIGGLTSEWGSEDWN